MTQETLPYLWWLMAAALIAPALVRAWDIGAMVADALEAAHVPRKVAADAMGVSEADLSRAIAGAGPIHLSADRLTRLPDSVWVQLYLALGERFGFADPADTRARHEAQAAYRAARDHAGARHAA